MNYKKLRDLTDEEYAKIKFAEKWATFHGTPKTRRDFMTAGLITGTAGLILPSLLPLLSPSKADAAACAGGSGNGILQVDLQNGWSAGVNMLMMDKSGNPLASYQDQGLGTGALATSTATAPFTSVGGPARGPLFGQQSGFLAGFLTKATAATMAKINVMVICGESQNDTNTNQLDATPMIAALNGGSGFLPIVGPNPQETPALLPAVSALSVNSPTDVTNAVGVQGALQSLSTAQKGSLFNLVNSLSASQLANIGNVSGAAMITAMVNQATSQNASLIANPAGGLDPTQATGFNTGNVFNFNNSGDLQNATIIYNTFNGNSPGGCINVTGYDYHGQGKTVETAKDNAAGVLVGQAMQALANMNQRGVVMVTSAGSVGFPLSTTFGAGASGDDASKGTIILFMYDPAGAHPSCPTQVGGYVAQTDNSTNVDPSFSFSNNPGLLTAAAMANICSWQGRTTAFLNMPTVGNSFQQQDFQQNVALATNIAGAKQAG